MSIQFMIYCFYCPDINECEISADNCDQICNNTIGSFLCDCEAGYELYNGSICIGEGLVEVKSIIIQLSCNRY